MTTQAQNAGKCRENTVTAQNSNKKTQYSPNAARGNGVLSDTKKKQRERRSECSTRGAANLAEREWSSSISGGPAAEGCLTSVPGSTIHELSTTQVVAQYKEAVKLQHVQYQRSWSTAVAS
eukprot:3941348-Rhodomonas_salina.2